MALDWNEMVRKAESFADKFAVEVRQHLPGKTFNPGIVRVNAQQQSLIAQLYEQVNALDARLAAVEAQPMRYDGPHEAGKTYARGTFVSRGGSLWHANRTTNSTPGDGPAWILAVKAGRDAR